MNRPAGSILPEPTCCSATSAIGRLASPTTTVPGSAAGSWSSCASRSADRASAAGSQSHPDNQRTTLRATCSSERERFRVHWIPSGPKLTSGASIRQFAATAAASGSGGETANGPEPQGHVRTKSPPGPS